MDTKNPYIGQVIKDLDEGEFFPADEVELMKGHPMNGSDCPFCESGKRYYKLSSGVLKCSSCGKTNIN